MLSLNVVTHPVDQTWSLERIGREARPSTWEAVFEDAAPELHDISTILEEQERTYGTYYPLKRDIFTALHLTPLSTVKLVILGQDPYPQSISINGTSLPRAVGLSFSIRQEDTVPSSLQNIYTEIANTVKGFVKPDHGDLREWARQGVLMLNSCLTLRPGTPGSHGDIWLGFVNKIFKAIAAVNPYCIFLLWGREAQKVKPMLGERSIILEAAHPSGLSARRGFFGCNHFNQVNELLVKQGKTGINWRISSLRELRTPVAPVNAPRLESTFQPRLVPIDTNKPGEVNRPQIIPTTAMPIIKPLPLISKLNNGPPPGIVPPPKSSVPIIPHTREAVPIEPSTSPIGGAFLPTLFHVRTLTPPPTTQEPEPTPPQPQPTTPPIPIIPKINFGTIQPNVNIIQVHPTNRPQF